MARCARTDRATRRRAQFGSGVIELVKVVPVRRPEAQAKHHCALLSQLESEAEVNASLCSEPSCPKLTSSPDLIAEASLEPPLRFSSGCGT